MPEQSRSASRSSVITHDPPRDPSGGSGATRPPDGDSPLPGRASAGEIALRPRCPYLSGRPPHGSFHLAPSGVNVCYAQPRQEKPYSHVSKETQAARCFGGTEPFERCPDYEHAHIQEIPLPIFERHSTTRPAVAGAGALVHRRRVKRRHRRSHLQRWLKENGRSTLICAGWVVLALAAFTLLLRSL